MKKSLVETVSVDGHEYGQRSSPDDLMKAQQFAHERISSAVRDFINGYTAEIQGFGYELGADMTLDISRPGRIYTSDGISYDQLQDVSIELEPADDDLPRFDLVVAKIEDEVDAELDLMPFSRLRTTDELEDDVQPYAPQNFSRPTELHWKATPILKTGTPAATPAAPAYASNEIPLYMIAVAPGVTHIGNADILDLRDPVKTLRQLDTLADEHTRSLTSIAARLGLLEQIETRPVNMPQVFGQIKSLGDILAELNNRISAANDIPEIRYDRPKYSLTDKRTAQIVATGGSVSSVPYVDIPFGGRVNFGASEFSIVPRKFEDQTVTPRFVALSGYDASNTARDVTLNLEGVTQIASDGDTDFLQRSANFLAARSRPACAARDSRYIEVFGGLAGDNASALSDWLTYDTTNDTLTSRTPLVSLPTADRPALFSYGDGTNVLLIAGSSATSTPRVFKINCSTGGVTEYTTGIPTGVQFFGALLTSGKIFVVALRLVSGAYVTDYWEFDTATHTFTNLGVTGSVPAPELDAASGCFYIENTFVMTTFDPTTVGSGRTYLFDRTTLQWTELAIAQPYGGAPNVTAPLTGFRMTNIGGTPTLAGGYLTVDGDAARAKIWTLKTSSGGIQWAKSDATFTPLSQMGLCSLLGSTSLPNGRSCMFGGRFSPPAGIAGTHIYLSSQAGLIAAAYNGLTGISIAASSTFVQFEVPSFTAAFQVLAYLASFTGDFNPESVKAEVSLDDGTHWHTVTPDRTYAISDSANPGVRRLRVTLYQSYSKPPILTKLFEVMNSVGAILEDRIVVRYNSPNTTKALYIDRFGSITLSATIEPSTPDKALIHKVTPNGTSAPTLKNYINRRNGRFVTTIGPVNNAVGATCTFSNELAVKARYASLFCRKDGVGQAAVLYGFADAFNLGVDDGFDHDIVFNTFATNGDYLIVEVEV